MTRRAYAIAAALALTSAAAFAPVAPVTAADVGLVAPQSSVHAAGYGFNYDFGAKHAVGTFARDGESCALTLVISDRADETEVPAMGARIQMAVAAGKDANLTTADGAGIVIACSLDARHVVVKPLTSGI